MCSGDHNIRRKLKLPIEPGSNLYNVASTFHINPYSPDWKTLQRSDECNTFFFSCTKKKLSEIGVTVTGDQIDSTETSRKTSQHYGIERFKGTLHWSQLLKGMPTTNGVREGKSKWFRLEKFISTGVSQTADVNFSPTDM